ncbi:hypothetical protein BKD30_15315 [Tersicoccus phoenicis]|uniref:Uncharacterized protein n=1 Tax=Tersicoccus phoenicis TaxID=554083 RepID=A0A1R1L5X5_9MICC|nr:hypothetical protein [Tersicoccus phoenicis]OMH22936.1 hypothetical protein BKD30_15315 [Tersicoccus phoenicis]
MRERVGGWIPEPDLLNLLFGALVASVINVVTALMLGSVASSVLAGAVAVATGLSLVCIAVGGLALVATRCKEEAVLSGASLLTKSELKAQYRNELNQRSNRLLFLIVTAIVGVLIALSPLILWGISFFWGDAAPGK